VNSKSKAFVVPLVEMFVLSTSRPNVPAPESFMTTFLSRSLLSMSRTVKAFELVAETFRAHPNMPLALTDFAASRVNWGSKGANLAGLAEELDLGLVEMR